jgi:Flp pilus assembly protein TadB
MQTKLFKYEKLCNFFEKYFPFEIKGNLYYKYKEAIEFSHLKISPKGAFAFAFYSTILTFLIPVLLLTPFGLVNSTVLLLFLSLVAFVAYYTFSYPLVYATSFRIKASSEMIICIAYMAISMRITPNLENAVKFAAKNLKGPLGEDLKQLLWDVTSGKYYSLEIGFDEFMRKWKRSNEEFTDALQLIKSSLNESPKTREEILKEAITVVINGTKQRMKKFARELRTPILIVNVMGVTLPLLCLTLFTVFSIFMPEGIKPFPLFLGYNFILPISIGLILKTYLEKRPYSFLPPDITKHPKFRKEKKLLYILISISVSLPIFFFGIYNLSFYSKNQVFETLIYSLIATLGIAVGIIVYCMITTYQKMKLRQEIEEIEREFPEALFQIGHQLLRGLPLETTLKNALPRIKNLKISRLFSIAIHNVETYSITLEDALFNKKYGAINFFPSTTVENVLAVLVELSKKSLKDAAKAMITISDYLKDIVEVNEILQDIINESASEMIVQKYLLFPITAGAIVAIVALIVNLLYNVAEALDKILASFQNIQVIGYIGSSFITSILNLNEIMPAYYIQFITGIYLIEMISIISYSYIVLTRGEDSLNQKMDLGKSLIYSMIVYSLICLLLFSLLNSISITFVYT